MKMKQEERAERRSEQQKIVEQQNSMLQQMQLQQQTQTSADARHGNCFHAAKSAAKPNYVGNCR